MAESNKKQLNRTELGNSIAATLKAIDENFQYEQYRVFTSLTAAQDFARNGVSGASPAINAYVGQMLSVVENGNVVIYKVVDTNGTLEKVVEDYEPITEISETSVNIWNLNGGFYKFAQGCSVYFDGTTQLKSVRVQAGAFLVVNTFSSVKYWYIINNHETTGNKTFIAGKTESSTGSVSTRLLKPSTWDQNVTNYGNYNFSYIEVEEATGLTEQAITTLSNVPCIIGFTFKSNQSIILQDGTTADVSSKKATLINLASKVGFGNDITQNCQVLFVSKPDATKNDDAFYFRKALNNGSTFGDWIAVDIPNILTLISTNTTNISTNADNITKNSTAIVQNAENIKGIKDLIPAGTNSTTNTLTNIQGVDTMIQDAIASAISAVYKYKGTVNNFQGLTTTEENGTYYITYNSKQTELQNGDVYNVSSATTYNSVLYPAGTNFVWEEEEHAWKPLGGQLAFDESPIRGSKNPVTSEGIYDAIEAVSNKLVNITGENGVTVEQSNPIKISLNLADNNNVGDKWYRLQVVSDEVEERENLYVNVPWQNTEYGVATPNNAEGTGGTNGLMSAADKTKLDEVNPDLAKIKDFKINGISAIRPTDKEVHLTSTTSFKVVVDVSDVTKYNDVNYYCVYLSPSSVILDVYKKVSDTLWEEIFTQKLISGSTLVLLIEKVEGNSAPTIAYREYHFGADV